MEIFNNAKDLAEKLDNLRALGKTIGFVPTMGALHQGHLSLLKYADQDNDIVVISIFVNPTQFNDKNDYARYPRVLKDDIEKLKNIKCDFIFAPGEEEMYPEVDTREFDFGNLEKVMEGQHRPGHFRGVALIVSKLFEIIKPHKAYFGEKDFQQVAIIRHITKQLDFNIEIISCPIIREEDGLAMSSRNMLLSEEQRKNVHLISKTLFGAKEKSKIKSVSETKDWVIRTIHANPFLDVEYFEIVDGNSLEEIKDWGQKKNIVGCIAVHVGNIRLIDNVRFYS